MAFRKLAFAFTALFIVGSASSAVAGHSVYDREHRRDHAACKGQRHNAECRRHGHPSSSHYYYHHNRHGHHGMMLD